MKSYYADSYLYSKTADNELIGLCAAYIVNTHHAGTQEYFDDCLKTEKEIKCKEREWDCFQFAELQVEPAFGKTIIHQKRYISKLKKISMKNKIDTFGSIQAKLFYCTIGQISHAQ